MDTKLVTQILTVKQLLQHDFYIFKKNYLNRLKMALYWVLLSIFVTKFFLPSMGLKNYAPFMLISSTVCYGFFVAMQNAITLVEDITGNQAILYELTLPIPQWAIFLKFVLSTMIQGFLISLSILPFGLLLLMDLHPFPDFSLIKFLTIFICASIFHGCFALVFTSALKNMQQIDNVWLRIIFPLWYLGCWQFPWKLLYEISPTLAYLDLLNPLTLIQEAGRAATIDSAGSLPFWPSCTMLLFYAGIAYYIGIHWMKKRLDCI